jgi:hypothetical protein
MIKFKHHTKVLAQFEHHTHKFQLWFEHHTCINGQEQITSKQMEAVAVQLPLRRRIAYLPKVEQQYLLQANKADFSWFLELS